MSSTSKVNFKNSWIRRLPPRLALASLACLFLFVTQVSCQENNPVKRPDLERKIRAGISAPEYPQDYDWLNTPRALRLSDLRGQVVILDFWTFSCINCIHVIPDLKKLEAEFPQGLTIIGIHSAKHDSEKLTHNSQKAIERYEIDHPVLNDNDSRVWRDYGVHAWPTAVVISPEGKIIQKGSGEGHYKLLRNTVQGLIDHYASRGRLDRSRIFEEEPDLKDEQFLRFPGKILVQDHQLFIADSNHNRIVVTDLAGEVQVVIGTGAIGKEDGSFENASFHHPQGIALQGKDLYIADTENHLIRKVDLKAQKVTTIAGTGVQGGFIHSPKDALSYPLNSPWDLELVEDTLYIAMAGAHQIWSLDLTQEKLHLVAGSGREAIRDGSLTRAALAQPSGITSNVSDPTSEGLVLYVADSEASGIREIDLTKKSVETLIGRSLFTFGDRDGSFRRALLQHPLGVAYLDRRLFVADTYNDRIKVMDLEAETIQSLYGTDQEGHSDQGKGELYEPGGIHVYEGKLYVADTNNHVVRVADPEGKGIKTLSILRKGRKVTALQNEADKI